MAFCYFSSVAAKEEENTNATSDEILEDVMKQLDKLGPKKRNRILQRLKGTTNQLETNTAPTSAKLTMAKPTSNAESIQDEVEILELHEPKLGTYKRKRSKTIFDRNFKRYFNLYSNANLK